MKPRSAYQWGLDHKSCKLALEQRKALGPGATQADWWQYCDRGDWLIWQLENGLSKSELESIGQPLLNAIDDIVTRAIRNHALTHEATKKRAQDWLDGKPRARTVEAARAAETAAKAAVRAAGAALCAVRAAEAAEAATRAVLAAKAPARAAEAAEAAELKQQADDIRRHIPEWPGRL